MSKLFTRLEMDGERGRFLALLDQELLGHMDFNLMSDNVLDVYHTFVDPKARGQGVAKMLLDALATYAKKHRLQVMAGCDYVASKLPLYYPEIMVI